MVEIANEPMEPGISVVAVTGAADSAAGPDLREAMEQALAAPDARLIVDLTGATFLDSAMLGVLAATHERTPADHGAPRLAIACPPGDVRSMFELTALDTLLTIRDSVEGAREVLART
jgi:anti-sigma B factor antagonist